MNIALHIAFDLSRNSRRMGAYGIQMHETAEEPTDHLIQQGAVFNNRVSYRGVFADKRAATAAVLGYVGQPCKLVEFASPDHNWIKLQAANTAVKTDDYTSARVLGARSHTGQYLADA